MNISYNIYSLLWKTLTKGRIMKKFILLIALSVLLYSVPGNAGKHHKKKTLSLGQQALALQQAAEKEAAKKAEKEASKEASKEAAWQALVQDTLPVGVAEEAAAKKAVALLRKKADEWHAMRARVETQADKFRAANDIVKRLNAKLEGTAEQLSVQLSETQLDTMKKEFEQLKVKFADAKKYRDSLYTKTEGTVAEANNAYEEFKKMNMDFQREQEAAEKVAAEKEAAEKEAAEKEAAEKEAAAKRLEQAKAQHTQAQETVEKARVEYQALVQESLILQGAKERWGPLEAQEAKERWGPLEAQIDDARNKIRAAEREEKTRGEAVNALWKQEKEVRAAAPVVPSAPPVPFAPPAPAAEAEAERDAM